MVNAAAVLTIACGALALIEGIRKQSLNFIRPARDRPHNGGVPVNAFRGVLQWHLHCVRVWS
jgi:hypothetical protein